MDIQTNHTVKLLNAKCKYVLAVETLSKKLDYGDEIECYINKLYLASRLIDRLDCYCFDDRVLGDTEVLSTFEVAVSNSQYTASIYELAINGEYLANHVSSGGEALDDIFENFLIEVGLTYTATPLIGGTLFNITANCDTTDIYFKRINQYGANYIVANPTQMGTCSTTCCHNCIKDSDLREMYAVLDQLLA